jgi:cytoskeletal protein CcmA (bactofilin family)
MFNRDALFGKKDDLQRSEPRAPVNVTPGLGSSTPTRSPAAAEPAKPDLRFAEVAKTQPAQARTDETPGSRLIVGPDIKLRGVEITDCDTLVVEGRVEASMDSRVIQIAENGVFSGTVSIDVAEIRGRFEGELTARKQLVIFSTGRVSGRIRYGKIRIEEGGELTGDVSTLARAPATAVREITLTGTAPASVPPAGTNPTSASAHPGSASVGTTPSGTRPAQATGSAGNAQPVSAAALREPAPSRAPRSTGKSTGANP